MAHDDGTTDTIGLLCAQTTVSSDFTLDRDPAGESWTLAIDGKKATFTVGEGEQLLFREKGETGSGLVLVLEQHAGTAWSAHLTAYDGSAEKVTGWTGLSITDAKGSVLVGEQKVGDGLGDHAPATLDLVFAATLDLEASPGVLDAQGAPAGIAATVSLVGETTHSRGTVEAIVARSSEGDLELRPSTTDDAPASGITGALTLDAATEPTGPVLETPPVQGRASEGGKGNNWRPQSPQTLQAELL